MFFPLVAGLGNPGREYDATRHNIGWIVLDALAKKHALGWKQASQFEADVARWDLPGGRTRWLVKPLTFMNGSGRSLNALTRFYKIESAEVVAVYDEIALDLGSVKLSVGGSAGGHNGVASLIEQLGAEFVRYRIGIGPRQPPQIDMADFVLGKFTSEQQLIVSQKLDHYVQGLELLLSRGVEPAMNQLNRRDPK